MLLTVPPMLKIEPPLASPALPVYAFPPGPTPSPSPPLASPLMVLPPLAELSEGGSQMLTERKGKRRAQAALTSTVIRNGSLSRVVVNASARDITS